MKRAFTLTFLGAMAFAGSARATGPITKGPWTQHVTPTSAIVRVEVDPPAPVTLELGLMGPPGTADSGIGSVIESREPRALHSILVKGLEPSTRYPFTVRVHGSQRYGAIVTSPPEDSGATFRFLVYGDNGSDDAGHASVVRAMETTRAEFIVNTGDFVDNGASAVQWQTFFDIEAPLTRDHPIFSCVGNHELTDGAGADYVRYFGPADLPPATVVPAATVTGQPLYDAGSPTLTLDQLSGSFRWSNARFFLLNGMVKMTGGGTRAWLEKALTDSDNERGLVWRIVVVHHGPWSSGPHGDNPLLHDANIPELLRAHKVDLVISGHDHIYERGTAEGLPYLVSGGGGAPVYRVKKAQATSRKYESSRHFIEGAASAVGIQFVATRPDGSTIERCGLRKGGGWDCDGAKSELGASPAGSSTSAAASAAPTSSKCGCRAVGARGGEWPGGEGAALVALGLASAIALVGRRVRSRFASRSVR